MIVRQVICLVLSVSVLFSIGLLCAYISMHPFGLMPTCVSACVYVSISIRVTWVTGLLVGLTWRQCILRVGIYWTVVVFSNLALHVSVAVLCVPLSRPVYYSVFLSLTNPS